MDALIVHENIFMYNFMHILTFHANFMDKMSSSVIVTPHCSSIYGHKLSLPMIEDMAST